MKLSAYIHQLGGSWAMQWPLYKEKTRKFNTQLYDFSVFVNSWFQLVKMTEDMGFQQWFEGANIAACTKNVRETVPNTGSIKDKCSFTMRCPGSEGTFFELDSRRVVIKRILWNKKICQRYRAHIIQALEYEKKSFEDDPLFNSYIANAEFYKNLSHSPFSFFLILSS